MKDAHNPSLEEIFAEALRLPTPEDRAAYLKQACGNDEPLRRRVEALLQDHDNAGQFLNSPPAAVVARTLAITTGTVPLTEKAGDRIGRYKLLQQIGEGGCGVVYVAEQEQPVRRRVALKVIKLGMDTRQVIARFEAERQALALMDHPNIAKVLDAGATETGRPFFVMELVKGVRITDYCDKNNLSTAERLGLFIQVCHAIQHAHQKGIIHRDIKPSNILVTLHDGVPVPKVIDFGIAKATTDQRLTDKTVYTAFEQFIGTPAYMSPEQAEMSALDIDTRSDIYSLGVLLYELLTGRPPFDAATLLKAGLDQMRRIIREQEPQRPSTRLSTLEDADLTAIASHRHAEPPKLLSLIRGDLDWIVMKALEKDRVRRYETATGFAQDILRHLDSEPVVARPPSAGYRFQKFARRNKLPLAAAGVVTTALVVGLGLSVWSLTQERKARENEARMRRQAEAAEQKAQAEGSRADTQATEARKALAASDFHQAVRFIAEEKENDALAYLVRSLKNDSTNEAAATRLATLLASRSWPILIVSLPHSESVGSAQFSPDGRRVVTTTGNKARVWDAQTGQPLTEPLKHADWVNSAQFSPDGKRVVTASKDSTARVWDAQTGQPLTEPLKHTNSVNSVEFSPDGKRVVTASDDHTARVWDAQTGQPLTEPLKHADGVNSALFSLDGKRVVTASWDNTARVWDAQTGQPLTEPLKHAGTVNSAQFSPDGKRVVTASSDNTARVWDAQTGRAVTKPLRHGHGSELFGVSAQFSPDGNRVVTAFNDNTARVWDAQTGQPLTEPLRHSGSVRSAQFSPDGKRVVTASEDYTARVWDAQTGQPLTKPLKHAGAVNSAQFSPDGKRVVTASDDSTARVWDLTPSLKSDPGWLVPLAEALSGETLNSQGVLEVSRLNQAEAVKRIREMLKREPEDSDWVPWGRWVLADPLARTISPFSKITLAEWIERRFTEATASSLAELQQLANSTDDAALLERVSQARPAVERAEAARVSAQLCAEASRGEPQSLNIFAWLFATSPREDLRDGRIAVILAEKAVATTSRKNPNILGTLAAGLAEAGRFAEAVLVQREALGLLNDAKSKEDYGLRLKLYESNAPYRDAATNGFPPAVDDRLGMAALLRARGVLYAQFAHWTLAAGDLTNAIALNPDENLNWFHLAPLLLEIGDTGGYREHCHAMLARFGTTNDPPIAQRTAKVCLLLPLDGADLVAASKLAETAVTLGKDDPPAAYCQFAKGLAEYRQANFTQAVEWTQKALSQPGTDYNRDIQAYSLRSMALHRLNRAGEAREALSKATELARAKLPRLDSGDLGPSWHNWIIAQTLLREAKALIEGGARAADETK